MEEKILIVDDDEDIRQLLERILRKSGFEVLSASSALDALVMLQDNPVSLLITDIRMPGMDGLDLIKQAQEINSDVPIVVITGYGDFNTAVKALERGAFYFINKPFNMKTILDVVLKGIRLPRKLENGIKVLPYATHTLDFSLPSDMEMAGGASYHASRIARDMGYPRRCYSVTLPFIIDELLIKDISCNEGKDKPTKVKVSIKITSERIVVEMDSEVRAFDRESYPPALDEIDFANEQFLGMMMVRHFSDELIFSEDGYKARVVIYKPEHTKG